MAQNSANLAVPPPSDDRRLRQAGQVGRASGLDRIGREAKTFWRFVKLLLPFRNKAILIMLLVLVGVPLGEIGLFLWRAMVDDVVLNLDKPLGERLTLFFILCGIQLLFWVLHHSMGVLRQVFAFYLDLKVSLKLQRTFYNHLHTLSLGFLRTRPVGEHMYRTTSDVTGGGRHGVVYMITDDIPQASSLVCRIMWAGGVLDSTLLNKTVGTEDEARQLGGELGSVVLNMKVSGEKELDEWDLSVHPEGVDPAYFRDEWEANEEARGSKYRHIEERRVTVHRG